MKCHVLKNLNNGGNMKIELTDTGYVFCPCLKKYILPTFCDYICKYFGRNFICNFETAEQRLVDLRYQSLTK